MLNGFVFVASSRGNYDTRQQSHKVTLTWKEPGAALIIRNRCSSVHVLQIGSCWRDHRCFNICFSWGDSTLHAGLYSPSFCLSCKFPQRTEDQKGIWPMYTEAVVMGRKRKKCEKKSLVKYIFSREWSLGSDFNLKTQTLFTNTPKLDHCVIDLKKLWSGFGCLN